MDFKRATLVWCLFVAVQSATPTCAGVYCRPGVTFGQIVQYEVKENESLHEIARYFDLGYNEITTANPHLEPFVPARGSNVLIPASWIIPDVLKRNCIVINIPEMRLYYIPGSATETIQSFPVGIGDPSTPTPLGRYTVIDKKSNPFWIVPRSIARENPTLPKVIPPGPDNPMGSHALRLSRNRIMIHGTNRPYSIGRRASHGCIRLYPEDMNRLFNSVVRGIPVTIVNQPVKIAQVDGMVYIEVHEDTDINLLELSRKMLSDKKVLNNINTQLLQKAVRDKTGIPVNISIRPSMQ